MIRITSQCALHQYDSQGRAITTWDAKKCSWIVNKEFEHEPIDWWGNDNDWPAGITETEFFKSNPDWDKKPDITVTWYWNSKEACIAAFGKPHTFLRSSDPHYLDYWDVQSYPYVNNNNWGYIDEPKETAVERFGKHCDFHVHADRVVVVYNGSVLFDGKLN